MLRCTCRAWAVVQPLWRPLWRLAYAFAECGDPVSSGLGSQNSQSGSTAIKQGAISFEVYFSTLQQLRKRAHCSGT